MTNDPISDMLIRLQNAAKNRAETVEIPASNIKEAILKVLKEDSFIEDYKNKIKNKHRSIIVTLKYHQNEPMITHLERISRPGLRYYSSSKNIPKPLSDIGTIIISTPNGVMNGKTARKKGIGGELICRIW